MLAPLRRFLAWESAAGVLVLAATVIALVLANSPWSHAWHHLWHGIEVTVGTGAWAQRGSIGHWLNDGAMVVFFLLVGLEIRRELTSGELATPSQAMLPIAGAIGGMAVPAAIYAAINAGSPTLAGWGIPMATDIAFAVAVLRGLGNRVPLPLVVFLTALAIVDDLGAVLVIALFYTSQLSLEALAGAGAFLTALLLLNRLRVDLTLPYALLGLGLWWCVLLSGIHATVAGVLLATAIPARMAGRWEHGLHPWVAFAIVPLFALANAGVSLSGSLVAAMQQQVTWGIILGLVVGKPVGITAAAWLAVRLRLASLPAGVAWGQLAAVAALGGIGFTMSLFIANLAFTDGRHLDDARIGILAGSLLATAVGLTLLLKHPPAR